MLFIVGLEVYNKAEYFVNRN